MAAMGELFHDLLEDGVAPAVMSISLLTNFRRIARSEGARRGRSEPG